MDPDIARSLDDYLANRSDGPFGDVEAISGRLLQPFSLVTDELEQAEPDDSRWLDAVIDVLASADDAARFDLRDVLTAIDQDYELRVRESSRVRAANAEIPERAELRDLDLDATELGDQVMSVLIACKDYLTALQVRST